MKKTLTILLALVCFLAILFACGKTQPEESGTSQTTNQSEETTIAAEPTTAPPVTEPAETTAPGAEPARKGAVIPPLQGGPMLYEFSAKEPYMEDEEGYPRYHRGLVDDLGKVIAKPQYEHTEYTYDDSGRVTGMFAQKGKDFTWYALDGAAKKIPFQASEIRPFADGRYWIVSTTGSEIGTSSYDDGTRDGLYDTKEERFVFPPTDGLNLHPYGGTVIAKQHKTISFDSKFLRSFQWNPADGSTREFPTKWRCQGYFAETDWYEMVEYYAGGDFEIFFVDRNMNIVPDLRTSWHIDEYFDGGNYMVLRHRGNDAEQTWANRNGSISELRYEDIQQRGSCYIAWRNGNEWSGGTPFLYDGKLNLLHEAKEGEHFAVLRDYISGADSEAILIALAGKDGIPRKVWDANTGKEFNTSGQNGYWLTYDEAYSLQNGAWQVVEFSRYLDKDKGETNAYCALATKDGLILQLSWEADSFLQDIRYIAVGWDGKPTKYPLLPFYDDDNYLISGSAGKQGPGYFWAERDGKRGFIDTKGKWLFVDET